MAVNGGSGSPSQSSAELTEGSQIADRYQLEHALGSGGMGVVWAARRNDGGVACALKFLRPGPDGADDRDSVKRFLREARAAAAVRHPHVVQIHEVLELADGRPVMVMERLTGESLRQRLGRAGKLSLAEAADILLPVTSAVGAAHQQGIVHRDLKPDNIFLSRDAAGTVTVKVLDFGIAKVTRIDASPTSSIGLTATGEVMGTPSYMSPEQVFGERDIDQRSDIWALGVIFYECLTGILPTKAPNIGQVFKLIVAGGIKPLSEVLPDAPAPIVALIGSMLARRREQRPFDLNQVAAVLRQFSSLSVPPFGPPQIRSQPDAGEPQPTPNNAETVRQMDRETADAAGPAASSPARRRALGRLTTVGIGTVALVALVGESLLLWRASSQKAPQPAAASSAAPAINSATADAGLEAGRR